MPAFRRPAVVRSSALLLVVAALGAAGLRAFVVAADGPAPTPNPPGAPVESSQTDRNVAQVGAPVPSAPAHPKLQPVPDDFAQNEFPARPTPDWVEMVDQGERDPLLKGILAPKGIRVEVVAREPVVIDPVDLSFDRTGQPYVLEWRQADGAKHTQYTVKFRDGTEGTVNRMTKPVKDEFKQLVDEDGNGTWDKAALLMNDLEIPSTAFWHDGWAYFPSVGHVIRRRQPIPGGPFTVEEEILRGLCGFHHHQVSGLALSFDGWLYVSSGDDDNRAEGSDGSRATVLRTGAAFRSRPDGSQVAEVARGFRNPYRNVAFDDVWNTFHVDNDQEDGSKFQGVRLMHVLDGADFGWRLYQGAVCCRTDFARGAVFGELPGKVPSMLKTGRGSPAGLLIYQGGQFPAFFRGLLIYPDVFRKMVRAYRIEPDGCTFKVVEQFVLMGSENGLFRPCHAVTGPDGAIYIVDWATDSGGAGKLWGDSQHGRIYRLSWEGLPDAPAIPLAPRDRWEKLVASDDDVLWTTLGGTDADLRRRALDELVRRGGPERHARFLKTARDAQQSIPGRAAALGGACRAFAPDVLALLVDLLQDTSHDLRRLSCEALSRDVPATVVSDDVIRALGRRLQDEHPAPRRAAALALGALAGLVGPEDARATAASALLAEAVKAQWGRGLRVEQGVVVATPPTSPSDVHLADGLLRGLERCGRAGLGRLFDWTQSDDPVERELGVACLEACRTREAAESLDAVLERGNKRLTDAQTARIVSTYRHILVEPPIGTQAVADWLKRRPQAPVVVQVAALETFALMPGSDPQALGQTASRLLRHPDAEARLAAIRAIGGGRLNSAAGLLMASLQDPTRPLAERRELVAALAQLRSRVLPFNNLATVPGVETVLPELALVAADPVQGEIRGEALALLGQLDFARAEPIAVALLDSTDANAAAAAVNMLGARKEWAKRIGLAFVDGRLDRSLLPRVAEVLQRHAAKEKGNEFATLLSSVFKGGLLVSLDPAEVARIERLVKDMGNPSRGRAVYLDAKRTQCAKCHRLEGVGGEVGPDLSKTWQALSTAKVLESMLDPSKEIKEGFGTWTVVTKKGQVYSGLKISEANREVLLRDATGKDVRVPMEEIDEKVESRKSLMPEGLVAQLSFEELIDLVAFLKDRDAQLELRKSAPQTSAP